CPSSGARSARRWRGSAASRQFPAGAVPPDVDSDHNGERMRPRPRAATPVIVAAGLVGIHCAPGASTERASVESPSAAASSVPSPSPPPARDDSAFVSAVDALAADALERGPIAGLSIAVYAHGRPVVAKGYGFADVEAGVAATPDTSYPIASV